MIPYRNNRLALYALILLFILILGYAYFEARNILFGPEIAIETTSGALIVDDPFITISGTALRIHELSMNGRPIDVTEAGAFEEEFLLAEGYNAVVLSARDKLGRSTTKKLEFVYNSPSSATSTNQSIN